MEVMPVDTRTSEQKAYDAQHGIAYFDVSSWKTPFEVPAHYECPEKLGMVVERRDDGYSFSCVHTDPSSDERGSMTPASREPRESRLSFPLFVPRKELNFARSGKNPTEGQKGSGIF